MTLLSEWMNLAISDITMDMVEEKHNELRASPTKYGTHGKSKADMVMQSFGTVLKFASNVYSIEGKQLVKRNPVLRLKLNKAWYRWDPRHASIPEAKLKDFYHAVSIVCIDACRDFLLVTLLTGMRQSELRKLEWCMIDFDEVLVSVPKSICRYEPYTIPLSSFAIRILRRRRETHRSGKWVFEGYQYSDRHICAVGNLLGRVGDHCGFQIHLNDIRRTFLMKGASLGIEQLVLRTLVNRAKDDVTMRYINPDIEQLRAATEIIGQALVRCTGMNVDDLSAPKRAYLAESTDHKQLLLPL
jgi:integrase